MSDGYFSGMSLGDWIGVVLLAPLLLALAILIVYITIGLIGSGSRRRRVAAERARQPEPGSETKPRRTARQVPGD